MVDIKLRDTSMKLHDKSMLGVISQPFIEKFKDFNVSVTWIVSNVKDFSKIKQENNAIIAIDNPNVFNIYVGNYLYFKDITYSTNTLGNRAPYLTDIITGLRQTDNCIHPWGDEIVEFSIGVYAYKRTLIVEVTHISEPVYMQILKWMDNPLDYLKNQSVHNINTLIKKTFSEKLSSLKLTRVSLSLEKDKFKEQLNDVESKLEDQELMIDGVKSRLAKIEEVTADEFLAQLGRPEIKNIKLVKNRVVVELEEIVASDISGNTSDLIIIPEITIVFIISSTDIKGYCKTTVKGRGGTGFKSVPIPHPHMITEFKLDNEIYWTACWGNIEYKITEAAKNSNLTEYINLWIDFLHYFSSRDAAGKYYNRWPRNV